jgi:predicted PhzF superfamily epimerase YddE/YHI9
MNIPLFQVDAFTSERFSGNPVTGSAHCVLIPYWSRLLNKSDLHARQVSRRGGELFCQNLGDRVQIAGDAILYLRGEITV